MEAAVPEVFQNDFENLHQFQLNEIKILTNHWIMDNL